MQGIPISRASPSQSSGYSRFRRLSLGTMPGMYDLLGSATVLGDATPNRVASAAPKNLSSALHMKGLLTTVAPASRFATSSMKAGGNDHSLPTMSPTVLAILILPFVIGRRYGGTPPKTQHHPGGTAVGDVFPRSAVLPFRPS